MVTVPSKEVEVAPEVEPLQTHELEVLREQLLEAQERLPPSSGFAVACEEDADPSLPLYRSLGSILVSAGSYYP